MPHTHIHTLPSDWRMIRSSDQVLPLCPLILLGEVKLQINPHTVESVAPWYRVDEETESDRAETVSVYICLLVLLFPSRKENRKTHTEHQEINCAVALLSRGFPVQDPSLGH